MTAKYSDGPWYERHPMQAFLAILATLAVIAAIIIAVVIASAPARGRGGAYLKQQGSVNRIDANSQFFDIKAQYDADVQKIPSYAEAAKGGDETAKVNLLGLRSNCLDAVTRYTAASGKYLSKDFKDAGLPVSLDPIACEAK